MEENNQNKINNTFSNPWEMLLYVLIEKGLENSEKLWQNFTQNNKNNATETVKDIIKKAEKICSKELQLNEILYRARKLKYKDIEDINNKPPLEELNRQVSQLLDRQVKYTNIEEMLGAICLHNKTKQCADIFEKWVEKYKNIKFWGFDSKSSGTVEKDKVKEGRLNKCKQRHLYVANNIDTAISEVRPVNKQLVSIAKIKIIKPLKMFDFSISLVGLEPDLSSIALEFSFLADKCSMPNFGDDNYYLPTQIISDFILELGYDGIIYPSSVNSEGKNYLIFEHNNIEFNENPQKATFLILGSDIYKVTNQNVEYQNLLSSEM